MVFKSRISVIEPIGSIENGMGCCPGNLLLCFYYNKILLNVNSKNGVSALGIDSGCISVIIKKKRPLSFGCGGSENILTIKIRSE